VGWVAGTPNADDRVTFKNTTVLILIVFIFSNNVVISFYV